jgi:hypothetical protein
MKHATAERVLFNTLYRTGRNPVYKGGDYNSAEIIGKYKIETYVENNREYIWLLNPDKPCMFLYIEKWSNVAVINTVEYHASCTIDGSMKRGDGTREMVQFMIDYAKSKGVIKIELQDESTIFCDELHAKVKLGPFSFLRQGKTWYEKYFGFVPQSDYIEEYERAKELRKTLDIDMLQKQPCSYFDRKTTNELLRKVELDFYGIVWEKIL